MSPTPAHTTPPPDNVRPLLPCVPDHDDRGVYVIIAKSPFIVFATHGERARLTHGAHNPDGSLTLRAMGTFDRLDLAVDVGHRNADRLADADMASHECLSCGHPIAWINKEWRVVGNTTSAGGLTYCPPDRGAVRVGDHIPRRRDGR